MGVQFIDNSEEVKAALQMAITSTLHEVSGEIKARTIRNSRTGNGQTKNAWKNVVVESENMAIIGNPLENAIWEELGTGEHAFAGNGRKTPWYVPVEGYAGKKKPTYNGKVVVVYGKDGKQFYKTDGKKPQRMLYNASINSLNLIVKSFKRNCERFGLKE